jgi:NADH-quinone oxidoreductase subunit H
MWRVAEIFALYVSCISVAAFMSLAERKLIARIQMRIGPVNCGPCGLLQPIADAVKLIFKRDPLRQCTAHGIFGVVLLFSASLIQFTIIPGISGLSYEYSLLIVLLCHAVIAFAETLIGLASKSKYGAIGGTRAYLQLLGSNLPLMLSVVVIAVMTRNLNLAEIACMHYDLPLAAKMIPIGVIFFITTLMSASRCPFDFVEAESEIVAGAYVEYGGIMFALIYLSDYLNLLFASSLTSIIFLYGGGSAYWRIPIFAAKSLLVACFVILIRAILPRFRQNQMIRMSLLYITPILLLYVILIL